MAESTSRVGGGVSLPSPSAPDAGKRTVSYFYDPDIGDYFYAEKHVMRPQRIRMTHDLVLSYRLHEKMDIRRPFAAAVEDMTKYHSEEYVDFLASCSEPDTRLQAASHGCCDDDSSRAGDYPIFDGVFDYCRASAGGSIGAAYHLNSGKADIAINWAGGLHHAKKDKASGFCYVNDIVLGILELLKYHQMMVLVRRRDSSVSWAVSPNGLQIQIKSLERLVF